ncbi:MAG: hypothetical protein ABIO65_11575 [Nitrospiria bacterium]
MDEWTEGKQRFTELVRGIDSAVTVVIPTRPAAGMFLIGLARGKAKKFVSLPEDDLIDLVEDHAIETAVLATIRDAMRELSAAG